MSIAGELSITMSYNNKQTGNSISTHIKSTRPLQASKLFTGKSISQTLKAIPLLFSICSKAQSITAVRAIESATQTPANKPTESIREALITLENLREHSLRVAMDWPGHIARDSINELPDSQLLSHISLGINQLMQSLDPNTVLSYQGTAPVNNKPPTPGQQKQQWENFRDTLSESLFACSALHWLKKTEQNGQLENWAAKQPTQSARFIHWLNQKDWKHAGQSDIGHIPDIDDENLRTHLVEQNQTFISRPGWNNQCYELSWFSRKIDHDFASYNKREKNNGIYNRSVARLKEIANLMTRLDNYFVDGQNLKTTKSTVIGMAHSEAARGRLTHYVEVEDDTLSKLVILAPTEWNFHPNGVATDSLNNLEANSTNALRQQAELLIHAIDPCVGYQLQITG